MTLHQTRPRPRFSVVIPSYNRASLLPQSIGSVLRQSFADLELLVCDDGSTDSTRSVVETFDDQRVRYLHQDNRGVSAARNLGLFQAAGEVVTFLDSDDEADRDWLQTMAENLDPGVGIVTAGTRVRDVGRRGVDVWLPKRLGPAYRRQRLRYVPPGTLAARRYLLVECGGFAEPMRHGENAEMALRLVSACLDKGLHIAHVDRPLVTYHRVPGAWSSGADRFGMIRDAAEYVLEEHGDRLRTTDPTAYVNYRAVAAVNAARLGEVTAARRHLAAALRMRPKRWNNLLRWLLLTCPPLARRFWTARTTAAAEGDR